jgi:hypothetical protein
MLCAAWCVNHSAQVLADFEIESFTRYRIDNFDNNNNGYVAPADEAAALDPLERITIASELDKHSFYEVTYWYYDYRSLNPRLVPTFSSRFISSSQSRAMQLERVIKFRSNESKLEAKDHYQSSFEVSYGTRYSHLENSRFYSFQSAGALGASLDANVAGQSLGPYISTTYLSEHGSWSFQFGGLFQGCINETDTQHMGNMYSPLISARSPSQPYYFPYWNSRKQSDFSENIYSEMRAQISCQINPMLKLSIGYSGFYFDEVRYPSNSASWLLTDESMLEVDQGSLLTGITFASLELRR